MSVQPSNGQESSILFHRGGDVYFTNPDGMNSIKVTEGSDPVWSPDGNSFLVTRQRTIWVVPLDGSVSVPLGGGKGFTWSPDGQYVIFQRDGIEMINKDGSGRRQLASSSAWFPRCPPTDPLVVYYNHGAGDNPALYRVHVSTGESELVRASTYIPELRNAFSPDGNRLLVSEVGDGAFVKVMTLSTGELKKIEFSNGAQNFSWSPDGTRMVFQVAYGMTPGLYVASADGQVVNKLISAQAGAIPLGASWSPSGDMIAFYMEGTGAIFLIDADGSGMRKLTEGIGPTVWLPIQLRSPGGTSVQTLPWGLLKSQQ